MSDEQRVRSNTVENMLPNDKEKSSRPKYLSDTQIQEVKDCSLKYINLMFNEKYTDMSLFYMDTFNWGHKAKRKEFVVSFMLMLSASEKYKDKSVAEVMEIETMLGDNVNDKNHNEIIYLIENKRNSLLSYESEESIHDSYDEYIENIKNSVTYFEKKQVWKTGGDDDGHLPLRSRGAFMHHSKNKEIHDIVDKKLSSLHKEIGSAPENDKITAICNYVMEKANHELLYSSTRESGPGFNDDNWSPAANKESKMISVKTAERYANEDDGGEADFKPGSFSGSFGDCDHFANNSVNTLNSLNLDQRYDFGQFVSSCNYKMGHAMCYLHDTVAKKIMVIDPWMNVYYDLENHEHFCGQYLKEKFTVDMTSLRTDSDSVIDDIVGSKIRNGIKYSGSVFSEHLKAHYKSV
ncbi:MAG: hypothetical protein QS748_09495 [Candidatus Endonucleobacter bathymodioli]|uniref:Uncharacterized protein n=1 Tax=Candidatus Endonucleibacter bathymodioli TaxID=539814 RepID=A0AA90NMN4_9GAMM|nr:hypothetical protein [Candidatus Endonucleobacter bathymodioli]